MNEDINPVGSLPSTIELPYTTNTDIITSSNTPDTGIKALGLYTPSYADRTSNFVENLRADTLSNLYSKNDTLSSIISLPKNQIDISGGYVRANEAYETLNDGTLLPKYEMYKQGVNNENYNASLQTSTEKFLNPIKKGITKVGRGIFADIGSFVYGVGEAALTGRAESLFDNDMTRYVDDLDKKTDFAYKNYYTEAQNGLGANLYTWDKVLGGAEFTARMLGAEAVIAVATGGTSLPASFARTGLRLGLTAGTRLSEGARALRAVETLEDIAQIGRRASEVTRIATEPIATVARQGGGVFSAERYARGLEQSVRAGKLADNLKQARFAVTGSAYEAGFEARHYQNEAENAFWEYHRANGIEPTQEEIGNFQEKLDKTTWGVFGANMAILSVSNLALFGNMLNIKNPFPKLASNSFFDRSVFRIGTERTAEGIWRPLKSNFFNKALAYTAPVAKGAFTEGVFEEGGQGIASGMMKNYMASTYDPKAMKETANYASAFTKAFKDQYSTKEGLEEVIIGGIIGGLFGGVGGIRQTNAQYKNQEFVAQVQNAMPQVADSIVRNLYTNENLSNVLGHSNRLQNINERIESAKNTGDVTASALHSAESFISMLQASSSVGKTDEFMKILKESLRGMNAEELAQGQNIALENVESFKNDKIKGIEILSENYTKAREAAGYIFGRGAIGGFYEVEGNKVNRQNLIDAFAYTSAMGGVSQQVAGDSFNAFQEKLSELGTSREITEQFGSIGALQAAGQLELTRYTQAVEEEKRLQSQKQKLTERIVKAQREEQTPKTAEELEKIAKQLQELNTEIIQSQSNKDLYWKSIADNFYRNLGKNEGGYLPQVDFDNFNGQTKDLQEYLNNSSISEFDKLELNKLLEEFNKANTAFKSFNNLANTLSDKKFTFKTYNNIFSGLRAKNDKSLNEITRETLINLYNTDTKVGQTISTFQPTPSVVTEELLSEINNEGFQLPPEIISVLSDKIKNKNGLTENEQKIYDTFKTTIDEVVDRNVEDPINETGEETVISQTTAEIASRRKEIRSLKKGIITPEIESEINRIDNEIVELQKVLVIEVTPNQSELQSIERVSQQENADSSKLVELTKSLGDIGESNINVAVSAGAGLGHFSIKENQNKDYDINTEMTGFNYTTYSDGTISFHIPFNHLDSRRGSALVVAVSGNTLEEINTKEVRDLLKALENDLTMKVDNKLYGEEKKEVVTKVINNTLSQFLSKSESTFGNSNQSEIVNNKEAIDNKYEEEIKSIEKEYSGTEGRLSILEAVDELEKSKEFLIQDRIDDLETEIEEIKSKDSVEKRLNKRKTNLSLKISNLRSQVLLEIASANEQINIDDVKVDKTKRYYPKVRKMRKLEGQLRDLNNIKEEFNPDATYKEQLEWVVDNSNILDFENIETLTSVSPPPEESINRFRELDLKKRKTKTEKGEFDRLKEELLPYRLVEGSYFGGIPLIDIISVYNQSLENSSLDEGQVNRLTEPQIQETIKKVQSPETDPEFRAPDVALVYDGAYVKGAVGSQSIHHVKLATMLNKGLENSLDMTVTEYTVDNDGKETYAETQTIDALNIDEMAQKYDKFQGVVINIGDDIVLEKSPRGSYFVSRRADIIPFLGYEAYAITGQPNAYNLLYDQKSDGTWTAKESEYEVTRDGYTVLFDKDTLNSIKTGDKVTLFYDPNDDYNKTLKKKDRAEKANIYIMKNGNLVNILKASPQYRDKNENWASLSSLRKEVIENGTVTIRVKNSYMGLPNITIDENGKAIELPIDESMVESYGYIDKEGNYKFFNNVNPTNTQYTDPYMQMGRNIPIVAFNYNGKIYTFPIQIDSVSNDATSELDDILNNEELNQYQKIFQINSLLDKYAILTEELRITNQNDTLPAIREALSSVGGRINVTDREDVQNALKTILLDMSDPFMSAKLVLDLKSASDIIDEMENKNRDEVIEPSSDIGNELADENMC